MNETKKMMDIIHQNRNKIYQSNLRKQVKQEKENKKNLVIIIASLIAVTMLIGSIAYKYNQRQIAQCMEAGHDETFCTYGGE